MNMDLKNKVDSFEQFCMINPEKKFNETVSDAKQFIRSIKFDGNNEGNIYPVEVIDAADEMERPPKCIFVPSQELIRVFIRKIAKKKETESTETFLLRFSLFVDTEKILSA
jgi:hypothetical protein